MGRLLIAFFIAALLAGCSVTSKLERRNIRAKAEYTPREASVARNDGVQKPDVKVVQDSPMPKDTRTYVYENGERIRVCILEEVVVTARSRSLPERKGKVSIDFVVTLPKELLRTCQSVTVTPWLQKADGETALEDLSIRGGLFSRVQDRNYWQYQYYKDLFRPGATGEQRAYIRFVKYPYPEGVRLDSIVESGSKLSYYYTQEVSTEGEGKKMLITLQGRVQALDGSSYTFPSSDTLQYYISSMLSFADTTTRYVTRIVEKYAVVQDRNYLSFRVNETAIVDSLGDNARQLERIEALMDELINQKEFYVDNISLTASASPEGTFAKNNVLARERAYSLKRRLAERFGREVDRLIAVKWVAEDWGELTRLVTDDETILNRSAILEIIATVKDPDKREAEIKKKYPVDYHYMLENLYPRLRAVNFKYDLRRVGMIKDTIHTTVPDTLYARGVRLLNERRYADALHILDDYKDLNCAIALMSLGYDEPAYDILSSLPRSANILYLRAILCSRLGRKEEGRECFTQACELDEQMEYKANLDPEISELLRE